MRFYGTSLTQIMEMPIRIFWKLSNLIDRVRSEEILDWLPAHASAMGGEGVKTLANQLEQRMGTPAIFHRKMGKRDKDVLKSTFG